MRVEYLRSVLRQEVGFFDENTGSSTTFDVISSISADAYSIQNVIAEKVTYNCKRTNSTIKCKSNHYCQFITCASVVVQFRYLFALLNSRCSSFASHVVLYCHGD